MRARHVSAVDAGKPFREKDRRYSVIRRQRRARVGRGGGRGRIFTCFRVPDIKSDAGARAPDFLSESRTQYRQLIIIARAEEKRPASDGGGGRDERKSHSAIIMLFVVTRKPRPCVETFFYTNIITPHTRTHKPTPTFTQTRSPHYPSRHPPRRSFNYGAR